MRLSSGIQQFWFVIGSSLFWAALVTGLVVYFSGWQNGVLAAAIMLFFTGWEVHSIKQKLMRSLPDQLDFQPVTPNDFAFQLDVAVLEQQTKELEALGFVHLQDYALQPTSGLARCFAHPQHYCFAEVGQIFGADGKMINANPVILSNLSQNWTLAHVRGDLISSSSISLLWRNPQNVGIYHPNTSLEDLLQIHVKFRQKMVNDLAITVMTDVSWDAYKAGQQQAASDRKHRFQRRSLLIGMVKATLFELNPTLEWLGNYAPKGSRAV
ncbi:MAG: hypothetical protein SFY66_02735 [Oculatellaceae cyanobacterium bins.114]|nr:hypothetical protein [Oculatellaceae cyanobacterium bins.114]